VSGISWERSSNTLVTTPLNRRKQAAGWLRVAVCRRDRETRQEKRTGKELWANRILKREVETEIVPHSEKLRQPVRVRLNKPSTTHKPSGPPGEPPKIYKGQNTLPRWKSLSGLRTKKEKQKREVFLSPKATDSILSGKSSQKRGANLCHFIGA